MTGNIDPISEMVGMNIHKRRKQLGLTQEQLSELVGVGQQSLSRMEKGRIAPKFSRLQVFADALQCSVADLFRVQNDDANERVASIADIIESLPPDAQDTMVSIMAQMAQVIKGIR